MKKKWEMVTIIRTVKLVSLPGSVACEMRDWAPKGVTVQRPQDSLELIAQEEAQPPFCRGLGLGGGWVEGRESGSSVNSMSSRPGRLWEPQLLSSAAFRDSKKNHKQTTAF